MEIQEFINLCAGKWFSQRTSYQIAQQKVENNKSEITIDFLPPDHPDVSELCQQHHQDSGESMGGLKAHWDNSVDLGQPKQAGSTILVWIPSDNPALGKLIKSGGLGKASLIGQYQLRIDEALTLTLDENQHSIEERIWFASPNLRLRTSIIQYPDRTRQTVFYSEIRKMSAPPS